MEQDPKTEDQTHPISSGSHIEHWRVIAGFLMIYDILSVFVSWFMALLLRFDLRYSMIPRDYLNPFYSFIPIYLIVCLGVFIVLKLYRSIWRFASYDELMRVIKATVITTAFHIVVITLAFRRMPLSYYCIGPTLQFILLIAIRFSYRFILLLRSHYSTSKNSKEYLDNIMVIGAGNAGQSLIRDIHLAKEVNGRVACIIDDNPNKKDRFIDGVKIIGDRYQIIPAVYEYKIDKIYLAIPSATARQRKEILDICKETHCELMNLPGMYQFLTGEITVSKMKKVDIEDLLGREPITMETKEEFEYITGKTILVTGAGGSIGSELSRQLATHHPNKLILFDIYENNLYDIQLELKSRYPDLDLVTLVGSVRDSRMLFKTFDIHRPDIVYHAAAHKHVPLMEDSPNEAIKNNTIGTYKTAFAAMAHGCQRFVLISTDKAVNPTNIMGASKRLCEMICQTFDYKIKEGKAYEIPQLFTHAKAEAKNPELTEALRKCKTEFVAVRFGNVLGSNGSVVPLFRKQIENGGPVTVTHPDIIRYFMTIPEAVSLVLIAGAYAKGGEIFVLDMGEPVKIDTLARNMIRLSGFKPDVDIKIIYTGLRPGEKLYEEKLLAEEGLKRTPNERIHIGYPIAFDMDEFLDQMRELMETAYRNSDQIWELVAKLVSTYKPESEQKGQNG